MGTQSTWGVGIKLAAKQDEHKNKGKGICLL